MTYAVKETFYTLQGEGANAGRAAVFCQFCYTDFVGTDGTRGGKYRTAEELAAVVASEWPQGAGGQPLVVCTGGEPLLQLDAPLIDALHAHGFEIAIETNGTIPVPEGIDWVCVSPKMGSELVVTKGDELKVVMPQAGQDFAAYEQLDFRYFLVQAMDGPLARQNTAAAVDFCQRHPRWRLSLQTHKLLGIR